MRKFILLAAGVLVSIGALSACVGGPPPPPPTDPHDVLVVGDSVGFSFGCVLGDPGEINGVPQGACPPSPDYSTRNDWTGACTIYTGTISLYNGGQAPAPSCNSVGSGSRGDTWQDEANFFVPKVVVINTAGWEITDRWLNFVAVPDEQWGAAGCSPNNTPSPQCDAYVNAAVQYSSKLFDTINMFRNSPNHPTVIVTNAPYIAPSQPLPAFGEVADALACSWWEPFPNSAPVSSGPDCRGDATQGSGGAWRPQTPGISYRSSKAKLDQFNQIVQLVKTNNFGNDPNVVLFNFKSHFNAGPANTYTDWVCPPPHDTDRTASLQPDVRVGSPTFGQQVWQCGDGNPLNNVNAINARAADHGHLSPAGQTQILKTYIDPCVRFYLNKPGGSQAACT